MDSTFLLLFDGELYKIATISTIIIFEMHDVDAKKMLSNIARKTMQLVRIRT
jgi:hypothetical protein